MVKRTHPTKDERDQMIDDRSKIYALEFVTAATQILTVICLVKENPAWKGSLSLLFFGAAAALFYKYHKYEESPYMKIGVVLGLIGAALLLWFGFTG